MLRYNSVIIWVNEHRHRGKLTETEKKRSVKERRTHKEKENVKQSQKKKWGEMEMPKKLHETIYVKHFLMKVSSITAQQNK